MTNRKTHPSFDPDWTVAPGVTLQEWREERKLGQAAAAKLCAKMAIDVYRSIEAGTEEITPPLAEALAWGTEISAAFWLNYDRRYRADLRAGKRDVTP